MRKVLVFNILIAAAPALLFAGWWRTYGTSGTEDAFCVQNTLDGGYIISGQSEPTPGGWIIKTDDVGITQWSSTFIDEFLLGGLCIQTADGGYVVTIGGRLVKLDAAGDSVWGNDPALYWSAITWFEETSDGNFIATGYVEEHHGPDDDRSKLTIAKLNSDGERLFNYAIGGMKGELDGGFYIQETADSGYIVCGWRDNGASLWLVKFDYEGHDIWGKNVDSLVMGRCVRQTSDGGYIVTSGYKMLKTDSLGNIEWTKAWGEGADEAYSLIVAPDEGFVVTGGKYPSGSSGWEDCDALLFKTDSEGEVVWSRTYGGSRRDVGHCVQVAPDGGYIVAGATSSCGEGSLDYYLIKTDSAGIVSIDEEQITDASNWEVTPIGREIILKYRDRPRGLCAQVFDASGRRVDEISSSGSCGILTWGETASPGVYFIREISDNPITRKVILAK